MPKVVYNACYGGFSISREAVLLGRDISNNPDWAGPCIFGDTFSDGTKVEYNYGGCDLPRTDPTLIEVIKQMGKAANGEFAKLKIVELEQGAHYRIDESFGLEIVKTKGPHGWKRTS